MAKLVVLAAATLVLGTLVPAAAQTYLPGTGSSPPGSTWREQRGNDDWRNNSWREQRFDQDWRNNDWRQRRSDEDWQRREDYVKRRTPNNATDRGYSFDKGAGTSAETENKNKNCGTDTDRSGPCLNRPSSTTGNPATTDVPASGGYGR